VAQILYRLWKISGGMSSKHLKAFILENRDTLWDYPELKDVPEEKRGLINRVSHATIDRLLKPYRERYNDKYIPYPIRKKRRKSAHLVKGKIDIELWKDKRPEKPGYIEIDLVEHNGGNSKGEFIYTLCGVDVKTYWVFLRVLKNKARVWTVEALGDIITTSPFDIYHIHSDNGSEFINLHLLEFSSVRGIKLTRSREHVSNDNPHVENRNMVVVRRYVGYARYDTEKELKILKEMYYYIELRHNFFVPTMRLTAKEKVGKRYKRVSDIKTPYQRVIEDPSIGRERKEALIEFKKKLDIVKINKAIVKLYGQLERIHRRKKEVNS
jgi:transposase InsO family protein